MKRFFIITLFLISYLPNSEAQKKYVSFELIGNGIVYSVNHEWITESNKNITVGAYIVPFTIKDIVKKGFGVPVSYSYLIPTNKSNFEIGVGFTFLYGYKYYYELNDSGSIKETPLGSLYLVTRLGYRKNWSNKYLRFSINPIYYINDNLFNYSSQNSTTLIIGQSNWGMVIGIAFGFKYK